MLPTIGDEPYSGAALCVLPIKSARRVNLTNEVTGESLRPDFVFLDDIQTDEIAQSDVLFNIFSALAQFERRLIQERTKAGLAAARPWSERRTSDGHIG